MTELWTDPEWLAGAHAWVDEQTDALGLERTGDAEQPHVRVWSTVLKVPTTAGPVWFKANHGPLQHEAALVTLLAARVPDRVVPLLAADLDRGWMLMRDAGERMRELVVAEASLERWHPVLDSVARISLAMEHDVDALLAIGVPDLRLATLTASYDALMQEIDAAPRFRAATDLVAELCEQLAAFGIRDSVQHDDLHDGQVFVRDGRHWVVDWGDACVSHRSSCWRSRWRVRSPGAWTTRRARRHRPVPRHLSRTVRGRLPEPLARRPGGGLAPRDPAGLGGPIRQRASLRRRGEHPAAAGDVRRRPGGGLRRVDRG